MTPQVSWEACGQSVRRRESVGSHREDVSSPAALHRRAAILVEDDAAVAGKASVEDGSPVVVLPATYRTVEAQIREALRLLAYRPRCPKILLKPNLVAPPCWLPVGGIPRAVVTDIRLIEALLRVFCGYEVTIAEGTPPSCPSAGEVFERTGVAALARRYGARLVDLARAERFELPWAYGTLRLPALLQTHEYINVPKLKTHVVTRVSLGCKNQKGLLTGADKTHFHRDLDLHAAIRALVDAVQPALTLVDGILALEGPGPTVGRSRRMRTLIASQDMRAVDVACCDLMSMPVETVAHLDRVPYHPLGSTIEQMRQRFDAPTETVVGKVHIHAAETRCSRCAQSLQYGLAARWRSPHHLLRSVWRALLERTDVITGQMEHVPPAATGRLVCYGDCTRELAQRQGVLWVPGCPPSVQAQLKMY